jgi:tetratricopeptide (TPR) repeat protein
MRLTDQSRAALEGLKQSTPDSASSRELGSVYWTALSQGIAECVHAKSDLSAFLSSERDFVDFGLVPEVVGNCADIRNRILEAPSSPPYCTILCFSEWLSQVCAKILQGDKRELLEKEIAVHYHQIERLESETCDLQRQRREGIVQELEKTTPSFKPADARIHLDNLDQLDALLRQNLKFKKAVSKGMFFSVPEKRAYCERENAITSLRSKADDVLNTVPPKERTVIKGYSTQISDNLGRIIDYEDSVEKMKRECAELVKKKEAISPVEIEAGILKEIDYLRDLLKLAAKRLHLESCPFARESDKSLTLRELASCLDRILEFDPRIFHNDRVAIFGKPSVLLVPGNGNSLYDWKNNVIIVPTVPPSGNRMASVACGAIEYRLDTDEDKNLLTSYNQLPQHESVKSIFHLRTELTKDYIAWMTSEYKGYKNLSREARKWFEHEIAPGKNDIYIPPQLQPFVISTEEFATILDGCEARLAGGTTFASEEDLWTASILNYQRGKFERSVELLKALVAKNPSNQKALYNLGFICMKLMHKQDAIRSFQEYAKLNPQSWWTGVVMDNIRRLQAG